MISLRTGKCKSSDNAAEDHIVDVNKMVWIRKQEPSEHDTRMMESRKKKNYVDKYFKNIYDTNSIPAEPLLCMLNCGGFFFLRGFKARLEP
jgi:hypothetical protein